MTPSSTYTVRSTKCFGCGADVLDMDGPVHAYMLAAPGCWHLYCSLQDWNHALLGGEAVDTAQWITDSYAAQHASNPDRRNRQSVAVHLMSLCASLEHGSRGIYLRSKLGGWTHRDYPELLPRLTPFQRPFETSRTPPSRIVRVNRTPGPPQPGWRGRLITM